MTTQQAKTGGCAAIPVQPYVWHTIIFGGRSAPDRAIGSSSHHPRSPRRWSVNRPKSDHQKWPRAQIIFKILRPFNVQNDNYGLGDVTALLVVAYQPPTARHLAERPTGGFDEISAPNAAAM